MALDVQRISGTNAKAAARLCNFVTGQSFLLLAHQQYLDNEVRQVLRSMSGAWVDILGYASRAGDADFNLRLSKDRVTAVKARIDQYANNVNFQIQNGLGESESGPNERDNDGYYRAVEVYVYAFQPPPPKPPVPVDKVRRIVSRTFSKLDAKADLEKGSPPSVEKDAINDLLKLALSASQGKLSAEGLLGKEDSHQVDELPAHFRVNKMTSNQQRFYDNFAGGSVLQERTQITYQWGEPATTVIVETSFQFTWNNDARPPVHEVRVLPRRQAEKIDLVVPPDP